MPRRAIHVLLHNSCPQSNSCTGRCNSLSRQLNNCLDVPWNNGADKKGIIYADYSHTLVA